jgi:hypothetical protein
MPVAERCEHTLLYARDKDLTVRDALTMCQESPGLCWYGHTGSVSRKQVLELDSEISASEGTFVSVDGDTGKRVLTVDDMGRGFPTLTECEKVTGLACVRFGIDCSKPQGPVNMETTNCYCDSYVTKSDPCTWHERGCAKNSVAMSVAKARFDIENVDVDLNEEEVAAAVTEADRSAANALL